MFQLSGSDYMFMWFYMCMNANVCVDVCVSYAHAGSEMNFGDAKGRTGILNSISSGELSVCRCVATGNPGYLIWGPYNKDPII